MIIFQQDVVYWYFLKYVHNGEQRCEKAGNYNSSSVSVVLKCLKRKS